MITKLTKFTQEIVEGKYDVKGHQYSQVIKSERIKHNMTLEEMAKGICSISYLCKLENQDIIPAEEYVKALFERVNVDYDNIDSNEAEKEFNNVLEFYFLCDFEKLRDYYLSLKFNIENANVSLIKCFYFLVEEKFDDFKREISILDDIKKSLRETQAIALIFLVGEYYWKTHQIKEAYKYMCCLEAIKISNDKIRKMALEQRVIVSYKMKNFPRMLDAFESLKKEYFLGYPSKRQIITELIIQGFKGKDYPEQSVASIERLNFNEVISLYDMDILYYKHLVLLIAKEYKHVYTEVFDYSLQTEPRFLALIGYCAYKLRIKEYEESFLKLKNEVVYRTNDTIHSKFIKFLELKFTSKKAYELLEYVRYDLIPYSYNYIFEFYNDIYREEYIEMLCKLSRYKEALMYVLNK